MTSSGGAIPRVARSKIAWFHEDPWGVRQVGHMSQKVAMALGNCAGRWGSEFPYLLGSQEHREAFVNKWKTRQSNLDRLVENVGQTETYHGRGRLVGPRGSYHVGGETCEALGALPSDARFGDAPVDDSCGSFEEVQGDSQLGPSPN